MDGLARPAVALFVALAMALGAAGCGSGGDDNASNDLAKAADAQTITFQEPEDPGPEPFTEPADESGSATVDLPETPFGGSGSDKVCDRDKLIRFLKEHPDRLREWARVLDITPTYKAVSKYIAGLHPVTLTRDTQVTNHSFSNGRAVPFQAILQAGTAVLVDDYGRPVARCRCGNPLKEPVVRRTATCNGCPANYKPPSQCTLYTREVNLRRELYTKDSYENGEYDTIYIDALRSSPYEGCYAAYPDPPVVTIVRIYKPPATSAPAPAPAAPTETTPPETTPTETTPTETTPTETTPPEQTPPARDPNYDCPDQPPAHPGEDYLRNCG